MLQDIPSFCHTPMPCSVVLAESGGHGLFQDTVHLSPEHIGSNTSSEFTDKDQTQENGELTVARS